MMQVYLEQGQGPQRRASAALTPSGNGALMRSSPPDVDAAPAAAGLAEWSQQQTGTVGDMQNERWMVIAKLLSRKRDRIDPLHALSLLPDVVRLPCH